MEDYILYQPGCYGDGSFGPYHTMRKVFEIALSEGWPVEITPFDLMDISRDDNLVETINELENNAIDYLNEHCADEDHYWGYENGDFGYWEREEE